VWADLINAQFSSQNKNQFSARATGGVRFVTGVNAAGNPSTGVKVNPGSGTWVTLSDRNMKENLEPVDGLVVLEQLVELPISTWNYVSQDTKVRHMGPMAQDFAAIGLGMDDVTIATVDADGVALAAIQGLYQIVQEQEQENAELRERLAALEALVAQMAE